MSWLWWWPSATATPQDKGSEISPNGKLSPHVAQDIESQAVYHAVVATPVATSGLTVAAPRHESPGHGQDATSTQPQWCGFVATYGRFAGPSLLGGVFLSLLWTLLLIAVNAAPTRTINVLFRTQAIDDGDFWLLPAPTKSHPTAMVVVITSLVVCAVYYVYLLFLLVWRRKDVSIVDDPVDPVASSCVTCLCDITKQCFGALDDEARPYLKVSEELPEIAYQTLLLYVYMAHAIDPNLVVCFAVVIATNCLVRCYRVFARESYHERNDSLANALFQFFFAVLFPVIQLIHAATAFAFDRDLHALRLMYFQVGSFERLARFAQPSSYITTHTISKPLVELFILSDNATLAVATCGLHLAFLWRAHDIVLGCLLGYKTRRVPASALISQDDSLWNILRGVKAIYGFLIKIVLACLCVSAKWIPRIFAVVLFSYGVAVVVATSVGVTLSSRVCEPFRPQCALHAHEFHGFALNDYKACACIVYVSQPSGLVTSWSQWSSREDVTSELSAVALSRTLQVVQIVDRDLPKLPDLLAECEELRELVLLRTSLQSLPTWLVDMEELTLLHIGGDINTTLDTFPLETEFFAKMHNLRLLRLEDLELLARLPSFPQSSLSSLNAIVLINLPLIRSIPVMNYLEHLHVLVLNQMTSLQRLPLLPAATLTALHVEMPTALCCNGYLDSTHVKACATTTTTTNSTVSDSTPLADQCLTDYSGANATISCLSSDTLSTTQTLLTQQWLRDSLFQCDPFNRSGTDLRMTSDGLRNNITRASVSACDGSMYRECSLTWPILPDNVAAGMCLGEARLQIVHCVPKDPRYEAVRRAEIRLNYGRDCQPKFESWLGC